MKIIQKHYLKCNVFILLSLLMLFCLNYQASAIKPEFNVSGSLVLNTEVGEGQIKACFFSVVFGTGTWYYKYEWEITEFIFNNADYSFWAVLPYYGYTQVTAEKLANMIWYDNDLGLGDITSNIVDALVVFLQDDHDNAPDLSLPENHTWTPYAVWNWRCVYMEDMYAENSIDQTINANCWGTADYLTRSFEWADAYPTNKQEALDGGMSQWGATFPHIYLDGTMDGNQYSIDHDLESHPDRFHLMAHNNFINEDLHYYINTFDLIRLAVWWDEPDVEELHWDGNNLYAIYHAVVYLCKDMNGIHWCYEKDGYGNPSHGNYRIQAFDDNYPYSGIYYHSYFQHDYDYKLTWANHLDLNYAGIVP